MESAVNQLRQYREENSRAHDEIIELWMNILCKRDLASLGDEKWIILEQIFKSALHTSHRSLASQCLEQLIQQFGSTSRRISILQAMFYESTEEYNKAKEIYSRLSKENEIDPIVWKRRISILKEQNQIREAIRELNEYLKLYQADHEGWGELCDLHLSKHDYEKAGFCAEELLLFNPHNHLYHERYASICYTNHKFDQARTYYFSAIKLDPMNMRALFGILLTSVNKKTRSTIANDEIIRDEILEIYRKKQPELVPIVEKQLLNFLPN